MKRLVSALLAASLLATPVVASDSFYHAPGIWTVVGTKAEGTANPTCHAEFAFSDGSLIRVVKDLKDGELYMTIYNTDWQITDPRGSKNTLRLIYGSSRGDSNLLFDYIVLQKNIIVIPQINPDKFVMPFARTAVMSFIMPGNIPNLRVPLTGSSQAIIGISDCMDASKSVNLYPEIGKSSNP